MKSKLPQLKSAPISSRILVLFLVFGISACASDPKKPSPVVTQVERVQKTLKQFSNAYKNREEKGIFSKLDPQAERLDLVREAILADFKQDRTATLVFVIARVEVRNTILETTVHWEKSWKKLSNIDPVKKQGEANFIWVNPEDPILTEVRGDSPFGLIARSQ